MNIRSFSARAAAKLRRLAQRRADIIRWRSVYDRYHVATMIPRQAYLDNLAIASRVARDQRLAGHSVAECGTWKGGMSAGLMEILGGRRTYHFFDSFSGLPDAKAIDGEAALQWQADKSGLTYFDNCTASEEEFRQTIARVGADESTYAVYKGFFHETLAGAETGTIALLRIDGDWYDSTMCCLDSLFPRIIPGGILIIDDYGTWDGCTRAMHDYLALNKRPEAIERFGASGVPYLQIRDVRGTDERNLLSF